jgi:hypothetical protein
MTPREAIDAGRKVLDPLLTSAGFRFESGADGQGSGGPFARSAYVKADLHLHFSYRRAVGDVHYVVGGETIEHTTLMRMLGKYHDSKYASFDRSEPMSGFVALRDDLQAFCSDFLNGQGAELRRLAIELRSQGGRLPPYLP